MIRPAVITDEITQDFERALDVMLEYGCRTAELRGLWGINIMDLDADQRRRAKQALDARGMSVCGLATPIFKCNLFPAESDEARGPMHLAVERSLEDQDTLLDHAFALGEYFETRLIRVFSFWRQGEPTDEVIARVAEALKPAAAKAAKAGFVLGLENEHSCFLGTGVETGKALQRVDSSAMRCVWDPGNSYFANAVPFPDDYNAVKDYVTHVHIKDAVRGSDGKPEWTVVAEGEIDYPGQLQALLADGYEGFASLETHYRPASGDTEEGSRACLAGMCRLLRESGAWDGVA